MTKQHTTSEQFEEEAKQIIMREVSDAGVYETEGLDEDTVDIASQLITEAHHKASQELVRSAYNDVWQSFKQQYSGTQWEAEMELWLRSFVVAANITPDMLKQEGEKHE